jgi:hypothetical protein
MRNDSRPVGEHSPASPVGGDERPIPSERPDSRDTIAHGRDSSVVHEASEDDQPAGPDDPVTPSSGAAPRGRI